MLSKEDPKDRELAKRHLIATEQLYYRTEGEAAKPLDARIDGLIEYVNA